MKQLAVCIFLGVLLASCVGGGRSTEAELSAFGTYVDSLDTTLQGKWFTRMGVSEDADSMLSYLRRELPRNGLDTTAFHIPQIAEDLRTIHQLAFDSIGQSINEVLVRLDGNLSKAFVDFTTGQGYGFMRPDKVMNKKDFKVGGAGFARLFDYDIKSPDYNEAEKQLISDDRMAYLRGSQPSDPVYLTLQKELVSTTDTALKRMIAINMERCRWQIKRPGANERYVFVNIPAQQLWAIGGDSALSMRICCGAFITKTPLLYSTINLIQVNPEWIIPFNIIKTDVARHGGDSAYFARNHYSIVDRETSDTLHPVNVSSEQLQTGKLRVVQKGGAGNSLGRIVFRFPNSFSVYLHDTNNRGAFKRERRTLSHGCVRVQKPFDLACFLLDHPDDWMKDKLRISMDIQPVTSDGLDYLKEHAEDPRPFRLVKSLDVTPHVPVYINYFTAYPNPETGKLDKWPDLYKYDSLIKEEIGSILLK